LTVGISKKFEQLPFGMTAKSLHLAAWTTRSEFGEPMTGQLSSRAKAVKIGLWHWLFRFSGIYWRQPAKTKR
jgi:hypothetical protein